MSTSTEAMPVKEGLLPDSLPFLRDVYVFPAVTGVVIAGCIALLLFAPIGFAPPGARSIGRIIQQSGQSERKLSSRAVWNEIEKNSDVYNRDLIRTEAGSSIILDLADGTHVELGENSLILVLINEAGPSLDLQHGSAHIQRSMAQEGSSGVLHVQAGGSTAEVEQADFTVTSLGVERARVNVQSGSVTASVGTGAVLDPGTGTNTTTEPGTGTNPDRGQGIRTERKVLKSGDSMKLDGNTFEFQPAGAATPATNAAPAAAIAKPRSVAQPRAVPEIHRVEPESNTPNQNPPTVDPSEERKPRMREVKIND